ASLYPDSGGTHGDRRFADYPPSRDSHRCSSAPAAHAVALPPQRAGRRSRYRSARHRERVHFETLRNLRRPARIRNWRALAPAWWHRQGFPLDPGRRRRAGSTRRVPRPCARERYNGLRPTLTWLRHTPSGFGVIASLGLLWRKELQDDLGPTAPAGGREIGLSFGVGLSYE